MTDGTDRPIQVGDLVVIVRACCDKMFAEPPVGIPHRVIALEARRVKCPHCGWNNGVLINTADLGPRWRSPIPWLKRIPPLAELENETTKEGIAARDANQIGDGCAGEISAQDTYKGRSMNASQTMLRAAQLLEHDAECLKLSHTSDDEWRIDGPEDEVAKREYDERLKIAAALNLYAKVSA